MFIRSLMTCALASCALWGQSIGSSISGVVLDPQGLAVQGAAVRITNSSTNADWSSTSSSAGAFRAPALPPGNYRVRITAPGFAVLTFESVPLVVGQTQSLRAVMQPAATRQEVTVSAEAVSAVTADGANTGKSYNQLMMQDLPMAMGGQGRNFKTQAYLTPAVAPSTAAHRPFAVAGARNRNNNYLIDSNDYNEIEGGMMMGRGVSEQLIPSESIEGMQVLTHNFKAEYGRQNGAIVSMVSRRGSNNWHGGLYEYFRHDALAARNSFDNQKPPLRFNFFGAQTGGSLKKDKLFLFANWEGFNRVVASATTLQTLRPEQRALAVAAVRPLVARFPEPNVAGTNLHRAQAPQGGFMQTFLIRGDWNISNTHRIFTRSTYLNSDNDFTSGAAQSRAIVNTRPQGHSLHHTWTPSASLVNEARFNYTRYRLVDTFQEDIFLGDPAINGELGFLTVNGLSSLGFPSFLGRRTFQNNFQYTDDLTLIRGRHTLKMGAALRRLQLNNGVINAQFNGSLRFNNVNDFLAGRPASYTRNVGQPFIGLRASELNLYVQDDWQVTSRLQFNLGLRYEFNQVPREVNGLIAERHRFNNDVNNFAPRFGFAWRADEKGKSVVRGGYGVYYNVLELVFAGLTRFNPPLITSQANAAPRFPDLLAGANQTLPSGLVYPAGNMRNPYSQHITLAYEREVFNPQTTFSLGYIGTLGRKLPFTTRPNGGDGLAQNLRPDPSVGVVNVLATGANSHYHGLQSTFSWQRRGTLLRASYTWSKNIDTVSDIPATNQNLGRELLALDEFNWNLNRGPADFDMRHMFNVAWSYEIPWLRRNRLLGGWSVQGVVMANSGRPYTLFAGVDSPWGNNNNRIFDLPGTLLRNGGADRKAIDLASGVAKAQLTPARGQFGTIGRNTERADSTLGANVSLFKTFQISDRWSLQFRAESYNLTNIVNYAPPDGVLSSPNFGQSLSADDARQHQLALRINF